MTDKTPDELRDELFRDTLVRLYALNYTITDIEDQLLEIVRQSIRRFKAESNLIQKSLESLKK